ncbi:MAG: hypothetical protein JW999_04065 [Methanotrichaceae archaeon]|nr:hypothetical protein [Methanotrichaceae archaeon]
MSSISSFQWRCIAFILLILLASPLAMCADVNTSSPEGNESAPSPLLVLIFSSQNRASPEDAFNISYLVTNLGNFTMMNVSLVTEENETINLNSSALLPGQSAGGNESIKVEDKDLTNPIFRRARAEANDPVGALITGENMTSINLLGKDSEISIQGKVYSERKGNVDIISNNEVEQ